MDIIFILCLAIILENLIEQSKKEIPNNIINVKGWKITAITFLYSCLIWGLIALLKPFTAYEFLAYSAITTALSSLYYEIMIRSAKRKRNSELILAKDTEEMEL